MFQKVSERQKIILYLGAISAPIFQCYPQGSWLQALILSALAYVCTVSTRGEQLPPNNLFCILNDLLIILLLGAYGREASKSWVGSPIAVPLILILIASLSVGKTGKVAAVLIWGMLVLYGILLAAGMQDIRINRIVTEMKEPTWQVIPLLLLPSAIPMTQKGKGWITIGTIIIGLIAVVWVQGNHTALSGENLFYSAGKSVSGIGSITRLDALISVVLTLGWFLLFSMLLESVAECRSIKKGVIVALASIVLFVDIGISWEVLTSAAFIVWVVAKKMSEKWK